MRSKITRLGFLAVVVGLLVAALVDQGGAMWHDVRRMSAAVLVIALAGQVGALICVMMVWRELLAGMGSRLSLADTWRINFIGQLGKYVPGKVWQIVAQAELGKDAGVPRERSALSVLLGLLVVVVTGGIVAVVTLPFATGGNFSHYFWVLFILPVGVLVLSPPIMNRLLAFVLKILKRPPLDNGVSLAGLLRASAWGVLSWACFGVMTFALLHQLGDHRSGAFLAAVGAYALSWVVGFVVLIAPAGIGAREAVMIALISSQTTAGTALALALLTRGLAVAGDALTGLSAVMLIGRRRLRELKAARTAAQS